MFGAKPGLERTRLLAAASGNPQEHLRFIHVAGTNGKGSTCAMLESIYRQAGYRTGLFTSPHLVAFAERIQVNRQLIPEAEVVRQVREIEPLLAQISPGDHPTFFEVVTVMALRYFAEQKCEVVIWETGLGGRLDSTNIVTPLASIITNIHYDHQKWLGATLDKIAAEKGGIIKPRVPVLTATEAPEALQVIQDIARDNRAPLTMLTRSTAEAGLLAGMELPLLGEHQRLNAALAVAAVNLLQPQLPVPPTAIVQGLSRVSWPGRLQLVKKEAGQVFLLDGAHNLGGVTTLRAALLKLFPDRQPTLIVGILRDKDYAEMLPLLVPLAKRLLFVDVSSERTATSIELREVALRAAPQITVSCHAHLAEALRDAAHDPFVVVTGSLYLIGEALELLGLSPDLPVNERSLNEY